MNSIELPSPIANFINVCVESTQYGRSLVAIKFILPTVNGYVARSDFLERRLEGVEHAVMVKGFLEPRQQVVAASRTSQLFMDLVGRLSSSVGGILLEQSDKFRREDIFNILEDELKIRISFQWVVPDPITQKRVV